MSGVLADAHRRASASQSRESLLGSARHSRGPGEPLQGTTAKTEEYLSTLNRLLVKNACIFLHINVRKLNHSETQTPLGTRAESSKSPVNSISHWVQRQLPPWLWPSLRPCNKVRFLLSTLPPAPHTQPRERKIKDPTITAATKMTHLPQIEHLAF